MRGPISASAFTFGQQVVLAGHLKQTAGSYESGFGGLGAGSRGPSSVCWRLGKPDDRIRANGTLDSILRSRLAAATKFSACPQRKDALSWRKVRAWLTVRFFAVRSKASSSYPILLA